MLSILPVVTCLGLLAQNAFSAAISVKRAEGTNSLPHPITDMTYIGPVIPGGPNVSLSGSAQHIHAQIKVLNPHFNSTHFTLPSFGKRDETALEKRNKAGPPLCNVGGGVELGVELENAAYLNGLPGSCYVGANSCSRISCQYNSGIYLCNDNSYSIAPSCIYLATYATDISNDCQTKFANGLTDVHGQEFDTDGYNVIVTSTNFFGQSC